MADIVMAYTVMARRNEPPSGRRVRSAARSRRPPLGVEILLPIAHNWWCSDQRAGAYGQRRSPLRGPNSGTKHPHRALDTPELKGLLQRECARARVFARASFCVRARVQARELQSPSWTRSVKGLLVGQLGVSTGTHSNSYICIWGLTHLTSPT